MPVLKATPASSPDVRPLRSFSMTDIESEAAALLQGAKARAVAIADQARADAARARETAYEAGYLEGKEAGHADGHREGTAEGKAEAYASEKERLSELHTLLKESLKEFNAERASLAARAGGEVPHLAVAIAERIVKRAGAFDPNVCIANATAALRLVMRAHDVKLNVHPADFNLVKSLLPEINEKWPALTHVELVEDNNIQRGGCRVYTQGGLIDADLQTQLDRIASDLIPDE
ncbi:MAG: FliH/SctL family protein [Planctomycetota bacterium]